MSKLPRDVTLAYIVNNGRVDRPSDWIRCSWFKGWLRLTMTRIGLKSFLL